MATNKKFNKGFTLVEMLVAIAVFMSVMVIAVGALLTTINVNKKNQSVKSVVDNVSFALDSISRDMRTGTNYACVFLPGDLQNPTPPYPNCESGGVEISYQDVEGQQVFYRFDPAPTNPDAGNIQRCVGDSQSCLIGSQNWQSMTAPASSVSIKHMRFYVFNADNPENQPRVLIIAEGNAITKIGTTTFALQTTVSQRSR